MSDLSKKPSSSLSKWFQKKDVSVDDISRGVGIVVGRGYEETLQVESAEELPSETIPDRDMPTVDELMDVIHTSDLSEQDKISMQEMLLQAILPEINKGSEANALVLHKYFRQVKTAVPTLTPKLLTYINHHDEVSSAVKLISKKLLTS